MISTFRLMEVSWAFISITLTAVTLAAYERCVFPRPFVVYLQAIALHAWVDLRLPTSLTLPFQPSSSPHPHWLAEWCVFPLEVQLL